MGNGLNTSSIALDGFVDLPEYRCLYFLVLFTAYVLILCSNSTIVCLIVIHRSLHEPMYVFIAALLTNSLLFSSALYPKLLVDVLSETPLVSYPVCVFQCFLNYSLGGSEFLLLAAVSYDRYVSICRPLLYPSVMRRSMVHLILSLQVVLYHPLFNPVMYGLKMKEIYKHLRRLFCADKRL